jgi:hypothetical protein
MNVRLDIPSQRVPQISPWYAMEDKEEQTFYIHIYTSYTREGGFGAENLGEKGTFQLVLLSHQSTVGESITPYAQRVLTRRAQYITFLDPPQIMRIHLPLQPQHFQPIPSSSSSSSSSPLIQLGGDLVIMELQGSLSHEGEKDGGVVGVLGLDRPVHALYHTFIMP